MRPLWRNVCGSLASIVPPPGGSELWYDDGDIPALRVDKTDQAQIMVAKASAVEQFIRSGYTAESIILAVESGDLTLLEHTGLFSVQLQAPGGKGMPLGEVPGEVPVGANDESGGLPVDAAPVPPTAPAKPVPPVPPATNGKTPTAAKAGRALELLLAARSPDGN